jgi:hypothetical protein
MICSFFTYCYMKLKAPIQINLLEFFKTGKFDYLKLGQTKEWILNNFANPDGMDHNQLDWPIWRYGNIELHFHDNNTLYLIYSDYIDTLDGGPSLQLDKWILNEPEILTLDYVIRHLNKERINFKLEHKTLFEGFIIPSVELLDSKVKLGFAPDEDDSDNIENILARSKTEDCNNFKLVSFSLADF